MMTYDLTHKKKKEKKSPILKERNCPDLWSCGCLFLQEFGIICVMSPPERVFPDHCSRHVDMLVRLLKTESSNTCRTQTYDNYCSSLFNKNNRSLHLFCPLPVKQRSALLMKVSESLFTYIHHLCNAGFSSYCPISMT